MNREYTPPPRARESCLPEGEFDAELVDVEDSNSKKSGTRMAVLHLQVDYDGKRRIVKDWIVTGHHVRKINAIAASLKKSDEVENKTFSLSKQVGRTIRIELRQEDRGGAYGWTERVTNYMTTGVGMGPDILPGQGPPPEPENVLPGWLDDPEVPGRAFS